MLLHLVDNLPMNSVWNNLYPMKSISVLNKICFILLPCLLLSCKCGGADNKAIIPNNIPVSSFLTEKQFNDFFPQHDKFYSYQAFIKAIQQMSNIKIKVVKRAVSVYQITRTDKKAGKSVVVRQDEDW